MSKIVLVTGASRGIGLEAAKHFSKEGYKVIGSSRGDFNLGELIAVSYTHLTLPTIYSV